MTGWALDLILVWSKDRAASQHPSPTSRSSVTSSSRRPRGAPRGAGRAAPRQAPPDRPRGQRGGRPAGARRQRLGRRARGRARRARGARGRTRVRRRRRQITHQTVEWSRRGAMAARSGWVTWGGRADRAADGARRHDTARQPHRIYIYGSQPLGACLLEARPRGERIDRRARRADRARVWRHTCVCVCVCDGTCRRADDDDSESEETTPSRSLTSRPPSRSSSSSSPSSNLAVVRFSRDAPRARSLARSLAHSLARPTTLDGAVGRSSPSSLPMDPPMRRSSPCSRRRTRASARRRSSRTR